MARWWFVTEDGAAAIVSECGPIRVEGAWYSPQVHFIFESSYRLGFTGIPGVSQNLTNYMYGFQSFPMVGVLAQNVRTKKRLDGEVELFSDAPTKLARVCWCEQDRRDGSHAQRTGTGVVSHELEYLATQERHVFTLHRGDVYVDSVGVEWRATSGGCGEPTTVPKVP